jgi:hypothetical protein
MVGSPGGSSRTSLRQDPLSLFRRNTNVEELFWSDYADIGGSPAEQHSVFVMKQWCLSLAIRLRHTLFRSPQRVSPRISALNHNAFPQLPNKIAHAEQTRSRHGRRRLHRVEHREPPRRRQRRDRRRRLLPWHSREPLRSSRVR